ncbi:MAG: hypothetical protein J0I57_18425 [Hyphomicrobium sp.]|nr:hypothetical protein [Hyphomicrobium sp.]MBN9279586.1 hypothetical protein [Hyphomicrobium sp.]
MALAKHDLMALLVLQVCEPFGWSLKGYIEAKNAYSEREARAQVVHVQL